VASPPQTVVINEVLANPVGVDVDWIELLNTGDAAVALGGWIVTDSDATHQHLLSGTLAPGAFLVIARGPAGLAFGFGAADEAHLLAPGGVAVDATAWEAPQVAEGRSWGRFPDGAGPFLSLPPTPGAPNQNDSAACGDAALQIGEACDPPDFAGLTCVGAGFVAGDLGCDRCVRVLGKGCQTHPGALLINEVSATTDQVEVINVGAGPLAIGGYTLIDRVGPDAARDYALPSRTLAPAERLVLDAATALPFGLGSAETLTLRDAAGQVVDIAEWAAEDAAISWCRQPDAAGAFTRCVQPSFGGPNPAP
jgi:hypothetical protein